MFLLHNLNNMQIVVLGVVGLETAMDFDSKEVKPRLMRGGGGGGAVHGQPMYYF